MYSKELRQKYKEQGLCIYCGKPREINRSACSKCLENKRKQNKRLREKKKEHGICRECNKLIVGNSIYCLDHQIKNRDAFKKWKETHPSYSFRTIKNIEKIRENDRFRYWEKISSGICPKCGNILAENRHLCKDCLLKERLRGKRRRNPNRYLA